MTPENIYFLASGMWILSLFIAISVPIAIPLFMLTSLVWAYAVSVYLKS
jgi:hypothetical protein